MSEGIISFSSLTVDTALHQVWHSGEAVRLTDIEYRLLLYLLRHRGRVCRRDDIIEGVWGSSFRYDTGTLDVHLSSLRRKLGWTKDGPVCAVRGVGLVLRDESPQAGTVRPDALMRRLLKEREGALRAAGIRCRLKLTPFVYEIQADGAVLAQIFSAVFDLFLEHAPHDARWEIASQLTLRDYTLTVTSSGICPDFAPLVAARQQAAYLGMPLRMGNKVAAEGPVMGVELSIPIDSTES